LTGFYSSEVRTGEIKQMQLAHLTKGLRGIVPTFLAWSKVSPRDPVDFVLANPLMRPAQVRNEFRRLADIVSAEKPKSILEIGTLRGGTLFVLCKLAHPLATIISVDLPGGQFGGGYNSIQGSLFRRFNAAGQSLHLLRADSHLESTKKTVEQIAPTLDLLFVDGDHSYAGVKRDFELYSPLVRSPGMIVFHDIAPHDMSKFPSEQPCEVDRFWREIKDSYRHTEIIESPGQGWAGIGVLTI
jgi:predicted O-methyltransferase YrrM